MVYYSALYDAQFPWDFNMGEEGNCNEVVHINLMHSLCVPSPTIYIH